MAARQAWLVALREMRERGRTRSFWLGLAVMVLLVVGGLFVPGYLEGRGGSYDVGVVGEPALQSAIEVQPTGDDVDVTVRGYDAVAAGRDALRAGDLDVLVVDGRRLEWRHRADGELQGLVGSAIQQLALSQRAGEVGVDADVLGALLEPVPVESVLIGAAEGGTPEDEVAAMVTTTLLLVVIVLFGNLVLTGVVEEKSSRVVEVLLARVPARSLLVGKVAGIGLLGLGQLVVTAVAALLTSLSTDAVEVHAVSGPVLAVLLLWFVVGYVFFAMAYGALGALASRAEDAQSVAGPIGYALVAAYWAAFAVVNGDPDGVWASVLSFLPGTAPFAMPARMALGVVAWWEWVLALLVSVAAIAGLVALAGRVYAHAILHTGARLRLREAWSGRGDARAETRGAAGQG